MCNEWSSEVSVLFEFEFSNQMTLSFPKYLYIQFVKNVSHLSVLKRTGLFHRDLRLMFKKKIKNNKKLPCDPMYASGIPLQMLLHVKQYTEQKYIRL